jgi:hypothetical protein
MPRCKYQDIVLRKLTEDGISKNSIYFQDTVAMNTFLDRHPNYSTKHIKSKKYIVSGGSAPNRSYYVVLKVDGILTKINLQVADFYSTHIWPDGKIHDGGIPRYQMSKYTAIERSIRHEKVRLALRDIQLKYGDNLTNAVGTKEFSHLQKLLGVKE